MMIRISQILLFVASILAFRYLAISQLGSDWEVPTQIIQKSNMVLVVSTFVFLVSIVFLVISIKSFCNIVMPFKIVYFAWIAIVVVIYLIGWSQKIYEWSIVNTVLNQIFKNAFIPGLIISLALIIILELGNRQSFSKF